MCIKESLRLYPLGALIGKKLSEEIIAGGYKIPKGSLVDLNDFRGQPITNCNRIFFFITY